MVAQFPPPLHGLSKAVDTMYHSELSREYVLEKVDITDNKRFLKNLQAIRKSKADLFYFTISQTRGGNLRDLLILRQIRRKHKPCLVHLHGGYYRQLLEQLPAWQKKQNEKAFSFVEGGIVLSKGLRSIFQGLLPEERIYIVNNCVDDDMLMAEEQLEHKLRQLLLRREHHVLYLSNMIPEKGYKHVLEMARLEKRRCEAAEETERYHFHFAGAFFEESLHSEFLKIVEEEGLSAYVTYHGLVTGEAKRQLLAQCDIFVLLTRYPNEGQPISILEAMGNGMMVITTDHAGIPDMIQDGVNGIMTTRSEALEICYQKMLGYTGEALVQVCRKNREDVMRHYTQQAYIAGMRDALERVLKTGE